MRICRERKLGYFSCFTSTFCYGSFPAWHFQLKKPVFVGRRLDSCVFLAVTGEWHFMETSLIKSKWSVSWLFYTLTLQWQRKWTARPCIAVMWLKYSLFRYVALTSFFALSSLRFCLSIMSAVSMFLVRKRIWQKYVFIIFLPLHLTSFYPSIFMILPSHFCNPKSEKWVLAYK